MECKENENDNKMIEIICPDLSGKTISVRALSECEKVYLNMSKKQYLTKANRLSNESAIFLGEICVESQESYHAYRSKLIAKMQKAEDLGIRINVFCDLCVRIIGDKGEDCAPIVEQKTLEFIFKLELELAREGVNLELIQALQGGVKFRISGDTLSVCDKIVLFRVLAKRVASLVGIDITYMPKPFFDKKRMGISYLFCVQGEKRKSFCEGVILHTPELLSFCASTVNSFLSIKDFSPYLCYGAEECGISLFDEDDCMNFCFEFCDLLANPYIALSSILTAGIMGIEDELCLRDKVDEITPTVQKDCARLPVDLLSSVELCQASGFIKEVLGESDGREYYLEKIAECKRVPASSGESEQRSAYFDFF